MFDKFMDLVKRGLGYIKPDYLVWGAVGVAVFVLLAGFVATVGSVTAKTKRRVRGYNKVISNTGLKTRENFYNLDIAIKRKKSVLSNAWAVAYPENVCAFYQALSYSGSIGQVHRTRTRRNFLFGISLIFALVSSLFIVYSISVGYIYFTLPLAVMLWTWIVEAKCEWIDERNTLKMVRAYNEFLAHVGVGIKDVYGIKICQCQCVADNFDESKIKGEGSYRALLAEQDLLEQKAQRERQIREREEKRKAEKNQQMLKAEKAKTKELKQRNERLEAERVELEKLNKERIEAEEELEREQGRAIAEEEARKARFEEERKQMALLAKQREAETKMQKVFDIKPKNSGVADQKANAVENAELTIADKMIAKTFEGVVTTEVNEESLETTKETTFKQGIVTEQSAEARSLESYSKRELKREKESLRAQYDDLQAKLARIRKENEKQSKSSKSVEREIERKGAGFFSDQGSFERTGPAVSSRSGKKSGQYDEEEVKIALADLMKSMNTLQRQIDSRDEE